MCCFFIFKKMKKEQVFHSVTGNPVKISTFQKIHRFIT
ncbi:hypothetical protein ADIS_2981 [Lunatimonas lonarensis]|uniref:Uncharacterized protein n=1 Tax=Lunatimonas lonarensis TaxID=1232681 RepID=R7ZQY5_9BACT|nr:hypothetical protein ADIS_2981 [Lunatimonas lonarensis]